jgi:hypothetical protein
MVIDVGDNITSVLLALIAAIPAVIAARYAYKASKSTDSVSSIAQSLNGGFEARVRHSVREVNRETGTQHDVERAALDAKTAAQLSADPPKPPFPAVTENPKIGG